MSVLREALAVRGEVLAEPYQTVSELAKATGRCRKRLGQLLRLSWLAPDIVDAMLSGRHAPGLGLEEGVRAELKEIAHEIEALNTFRNWLIHGPWHSIKSGGALTETEFGKKRMMPGNKDRKIKEKAFNVSTIEAERLRCLHTKRRLIETYKKIPYPWLDSRINRKAVTTAAMI